MLRLNSSHKVRNDGARVRDEGLDENSKTKSGVELRKARSLPRVFFFFFAPPSGCEQESVCVGERLRLRPEVGEMRHADGYRKEDSCSSRATAFLIRMMEGNTRRGPLYDEL